jgi:hypothetical protein
MGKLPEGWRIQKRSMTMLLEIGERSVLQPAPEQPHSINQAARPCCAAFVSGRFN